MNREITSLFEKDRPVILKSFEKNARWYNRLYFPWVAFFRGAISLQEAWCLCIRRGRFHSDDLRHKFSAFLQDEARRAVAPYQDASGAVSLFGRPLMPYDGNYYDLLNLVEQIVVEDQYCAREFLKEDSVVIDAGANIGTFSVFAAHRASTGKIYAFEPAPKTFDLLVKNTTSYPNILCTQSGLGNAAGLKSMTIQPQDPGGNFFNDSGFQDRIASGAVREHIKMDNISMVTIDDFVKEHNLTRVDFIKMDTEGYEGKILEGARETIAKFRPVIAMSAYHHPGDQEKLPAFIKGVDGSYLCRLEKKMEEDLICYPGQ